MSRWCTQAHEKELTQVLVLVGVGIGIAIGGNFDIDAVAIPIPNFCDISLISEAGVETGCDRLMEGGCAWIFQIRLW